MRALPQSCTQESFRAYWRQFGSITDATLMMDKDTGRHRGFGFVNYAYEPWHWEWTGEPLLPGVPISSLPQEGSEPITEPADQPTSGTPASGSAARNRR